MESDLTATACAVGSSLVRGTSVTWPCAAKQISASEIPAAKLPDAVMPRSMIVTPLSSCERIISSSPDCASNCCTKTAALSFNKVVIIRCV